MTMREVCIALDRIDQRRHNSFAMNASLHGIKIPMKQPSSQAAPIELSSEEQSSVSNALAEAQARLIQERLMRSKKHGK
jgi:hypothetical protein